VIKSATAQVALLCTWTERDTPHAARQLSKCPSHCYGGGRRKNTHKCAGVPSLLGKKLSKRYLVRIQGRVPN